MPKSSRSLETLFQALADQTRLRLLNLLSGGELCVCYFVEILGESQPKISRHLAYLRRAGVVQARREGKWIHYRIAEPADPVTRQILSAVLEGLAASREMQRERAALVRACGSARPPAGLRRAPRPVVSAN
jgi:ArsR family transcriptional regulator, arsenate/arsenite/antimonite-responsive transcriptional repressor